MSGTKTAAVSGDAINPTGLSKLEATAALARAALPHLLMWGVLVRTLGIPLWITVVVCLPAGGALGAVFVALRTPQGNRGVPPRAVDRH